mmetsp:Transcript_32763/g.93953  ORF Transcript_32763/g.93953 Transcript_32763/m.93953 type:complete len:239 (+) Transcript_32763:56-772(+)
MDRRTLAAGCYRSVRTLIGCRRATPGRPRAQFLSKLRFGGVAVDATFGGRRGLDGCNRASSGAGADALVGADPPEALAQTGVVEGPGPFCRRGASSRGGRPRARLWPARCGLGDTRTRPQRCLGAWRSVADRPSPWCSRGVARLRPRRSAPRGAGLVAGGGRIQRVESGAPRPGCARRLDRRCTGLGCPGRFAGCVYGEAALSGGSLATCSGRLRGRYFAGELGPRAFGAPECGRLEQ